jgi:hypothetical protein
VISIALDRGEPDVDLDLQQVLDAAYDRAAWDLVLDYAGEPTPVLQPGDASWARGLLAGRAGG